jgi:hypothetical protein
VAPPRTGTTQIQVRFPPALLAAVDASIAGQSPRPSRPEEIRRLVKERLAGERTAPSAAPPADDAELRSRLIAIFSKVDALIAYSKQVEAQRDAYAARAPRLDVVPRPGEQAVVHQSPGEPLAVERWPHSPPPDGRLAPPYDPVRGARPWSDLPPRCDPEVVARARAQLAAAEAAAEARRREEIGVQRD